MDRATPLALAGLLALFPVTAAAQSPRDPAAFRTTMVDAHTRARAELKRAPLVWDDRLAAAAEGYARELARTERLAHASATLDAEDQGENLWAGTRGAYSYTEMVGDWLAEKTGNRAGNHYTQMVSRRTTRFGCAFASGAGQDWVVCRYAPMGVPD